MEFPLLHRIEDPQDLQLLSIDELQLLAQEIRSRIISTLSVVGGHLSSNLGTVELTLALHRVFQSPIDKLIFDVSHQTYTHKLLTGRNHSKFDRIRQSKGLSGFAHPKESEHDHFYAGHAGTALSLALGLAKTRDLTSSDEHILPIIGDASLTCGLTLEALNNIKKDLKRFIVILNDNAMSISKNVGGISRMLSRLLNNPTTSRWIHDFEALLAKIPRFGSSLANKGHRFSESLKNMVSSAPFFEQFGLSYIGPIDGHDLKKTIHVLEAVKELPMPVLIHFQTKKGQGMEKAVEDPSTYHGVKPFDPATCLFLPSSSKPTFPKIFGKHLLKLAENDPTILTVTPAMSLGSCIDPLLQKFPDRCMDVGIAEGHAVTFSGGLAKRGTHKVVCSIYSTFLQRALDNLFHDVCLQNAPVVFAIDRAGLATGDGATHHGIYDIGFLKMMPNLIVCQPRDGHVLKELLESSLTWNQPTAIRYPNMETEEKSDTPIQPRSIGKGEVLVEGDDILLIALGHMTQQAFKLRELLKEKGISAAIVDPVFVKPLDLDLLGKLLLHHTRVVTIEEHSLKGGLGAEINQFLVNFSFNQVQALNFGIPEAFFDHGNHKDLLEEMGLTPERMLQKILSQFSFQTRTLAEKTL